MFHMPLHRHQTRDPYAILRECGWKPCRVCFTLVSPLERINGCPHCQLIKGKGLRP